MTPMERIEGELSDAQKRIAELERCNVGLVKECQAQQEQIAELKNALTRQAKAAQQGMDAAKAVASSELEQAKRLHAECNPRALESERAANALLTEQVAKLEAHIAALKDDLEIHRAAEEAQIALRHKADEREAVLAESLDRYKGYCASYERISKNRLKKHLSDLRKIANGTHYVIANNDQQIRKVPLFSEIYSDGDGMVIFYKKKEDTPATSLTHRDLIKQAEALELVNCQSGPQEDTPQEDAFDAGWDAAFELIRQFASELRQQAEALNESPA